MTALLQPASLYPLIMRLRHILAMQRADVMMRLPAAIRSGQPISLEHWTKPMADVLVHVMGPYWQQGLLRGRREVARVLDGRPLPSVAPEIVERSMRQKTQPRYSKALLRERKKDFALAMSSPRTFNLHNPSVLEAIDRATFLFCDTTNATATRDLNEAIAKLRIEIDQGVEAGESFRDLGDRVRTLFDTPRAALIATQESSRALNGGSLIAYEKAQCEGSAWLASTAPCPICWDLDGEERPFGVPFYVDPRGGPYATWYFPPGHPWCYCTSTPVLAL